MDKKKDKQRSKSFLSDQCFRNAEGSSKINAKSQPPNRGAQNSINRKYVQRARNDQGGGGGGDGTVSDSAKFHHGHQYPDFIPSQTFEQRKYYTASSGAVPKDSSNLSVLYKRDPSKKSNYNKNNNKSNNKNNYHWRNREFSNSRFNDGSDTETSSGTGYSDSTDEDVPADDAHSLHDDVVGETHQPSGSGSDKDAAYSSSSSDTCAQICRLSRRETVNESEEQRETEEDPPNAEFEDTLVEGNPDEIVDDGWDPLTYEPVLGVRATEENIEYKFNHRRRTLGQQLKKWLAAGIANYERKMISKKGKIRCASNGNGEENKEQSKPKLIEHAFRVWHNPFSFPEFLDTKSRNAVKINPLRKDPLPFLTSSLNRTCNCMRSHGGAFKPPGAPFTPTEPTNSHLWSANPLKPFWLGDQRPTLANSSRTDKRNIHSFPCRKRVGTELVDAIKIGVGLLIASELEELAEIRAEFELNGINVEYDREANCIECGAVHRIGAECTHNEEYNIAEIASSSTLNVAAETFKPRSSVAALLGPNNLQCCAFLRNSTSLQAADAFLNCIALRDDHNAYVFDWSCMGPVEFNENITSEGAAAVFEGVGEVLTYPESKSSALSLPEMNSNNNNETDTDEFHSGTPEDDLDCGDDSFKSCQQYPDGTSSEIWTTSSNSDKDAHENHVEKSGGKSAASVQGIFEASSLSSPHEGGENMGDTSVTDEDKTLVLKAENANIEGDAECWETQAQHRNKNDPPVCGNGRTEDIAPVNSPQETTTTITITKTTATSDSTTTNTITSTTTCTTSTNNPTINANAKPICNLEEAYLRLQRFNIYTERHYDELLQHGLNNSIGSMTHLVDSRGGHGSGGECGDGNGNSDCNNNNNNNNINHSNVGAIRQQQQALESRYQQYQYQYQYQQRQQKQQHMQQDQQQDGMAPGCSWRARSNSMDQSFSGPSSSFECFGGRAPATLAWRQGWLASNSPWKQWQTEPRQHQQEQHRPLIYKRQNRAQQQQQQEQPKDWQHYIQRSADLRSRVVDINQIPPSEPNLRSLLLSNNPLNKTTIKENEFSLYPYTALQMKDGTRF